MVVELRFLQVLQGAVHLALFAALFAVLYCAFRAWPRKRRRWPLLALRRLAQGGEAPPFVLFLFGLSGKGREASEEKGLLLRQGGLRIDPLLYELTRRSLIAVSCLLIAVGYFSRQWTGLAPEPFVWIAIGLACGTTLWFDRALLGALGKYRRHNMMKEIYALSHQLLYYHGSRMSLHAKLSRCLPFCSTIRADFQLLLNEWYEDAEQAIRRFKHRLGTEEAYSFAETINSLRLNEHDSYYALLRDRIQDYKEKLDMVKESRKETTSYLLFVIAGIPILNTFRILSTRGCRKDRSCSTL